jgi:hypothetical protein
LTRVAGPNVSKLRPERLVDLVARDLTVGVYPSDIAISGTVRDRTRARAAILSRLATTAAHLTTSMEAQELEDKLARLATSGGPSRLETEGRGRASFDEVDAELLDLAVPTDEWDILYRLRVQIERDLLAEERSGSVSPAAESPASLSTRQGPNPAATDVPALSGARRL